MRTGAILGMVGGRSFADSKWNMATQATRQPGSIFKPFVYLTALQHGYTACSVLMDTPFVLDTGTSLWRPKNFSGRFEGPMTLRYALSRSVNTPTAKLYLDFGLAPVLENVQKLGFTTALPRVPALFLGAGEVTLREVAAAYSTFANHGVYVQQHLITRVESADGEILFEARIQQREALDPAEAYMMTNLLKTTLVEGTGKAARWRGFTKTGAGKTGTTNESTNAWFCGFTPSFCGGVWVGFDQDTAHGPRRHRRAHGPAGLGLVHGQDHRPEGRRTLHPPARHHRGHGLPALGHAGHQRLRFGRRRRSSCPGARPQDVCDVHGGQLHDFKGVDKEFQTLDDDDDEF